MNPPPAPPKLVFDAAPPVDFVALLSDGAYARKATVMAEGRAPLVYFVTAGTLRNDCGEVLRHYASVVVISEIQLAQKDLERKTSNWRLPNGRNRNFWST